VDKKHNIHEVDGVFVAACQIVEVDPEEGVVIFEPTCSSWIWLTRGVSLRGVVAWMQGAIFWSNLGSFRITLEIFILGQRIYFIPTIQADMTLFLPCLATQEIWGNPSVESVVGANSTAEILGDLLIPICIWLYTDYAAEQPVRDLGMAQLESAMFD